MWERLRTMLRKEFIQIFRDPRMRLVIFGVPLIQTLLFGYAVTLEVRNVRLAVVDHDNTPASRTFTARFTGSDHFEAIGRTQDQREAHALLDAGRASAILVLNAGFDTDLRAGRTARAQLLVDGSDSNTARLVLNYSASIASRYNTDVLVEQSVRRLGHLPEVGAVDLRSRAWFNENFESRNYYLPGVLATLVMLISLMLTSMAIVREKEAGTIEQIMVTPIRPVEFILGKCAPFAVIGFVEVVLVTLVAVLWFHIPIRGSFAHLLLGTTFFLLSTLGIGLFISTVSETQQQAMMTTFFFFLPALLLSGFIYPIANMPVSVQWLTLLNPLRHFLVIIRGIFLKGVGLDVLWPQMLGLLALGIAVMAFAVSRFRKTAA